ncbi:unnamed protein product [Amoebophrya sp. A25]|nr:unnamed protein product [Amoebophrya sp. A25]|eukprot:GSA25T00006873001.1
MAAMMGGANNPMAAMMGAAAGASNPMANPMAAMMGGANNPMAAMMGAGTGSTEQQQLEQMMLMMQMSMMGQQMMGAAGGAPGAMGASSSSSPFFPTAATGIPLVTGGHAQLVQGPNGMLLGGQPLTLPQYRGLDQARQIVQSAPNQAALSTQTEFLERLNTRNSKRYLGRMKSFNTERGFGFVAGEELDKVFGRDVFIHRTEMEKLISLYGQMIPVNSLLSFSVVLNKVGQPQVREMLLVLDEDKDKEIPLLNVSGGYQGPPSQFRSFHGAPPGFQGNAGPSAAVPFRERSRSRGRG